MFSVTKFGCSAVISVYGLALPALIGATPFLRICADPNNLPYSNEQQQGFENKLAGIIAADLGVQPEYTWFPQRGAFFRKTLNAGLCDVVMGVPVDMQSLAVTRPYYRSGYFFVSRESRIPALHSLEDPRLRQLRIGVQNLGDSDRSLPPVQLLTSRGIVENLVSYSIFGNLEEANPASDLIRAVERDEVDVAVAWGPVAGYFARDSKVPLRVDAIDGDPAYPLLPLAFDIGIGVRRGEDELKQRLDAELERRRTEIDDLLRSYGMPLGFAVGRH